MDRDDLTQNTDPRFEMYSKDSQDRAFYTACGVAFCVVAFGVAPWAVGCAMLIKWIIF